MKNNNTFFLFQENGDTTLKAPKCDEPNLNMAVYFHIAVVALLGLMLAFSILIMYKVCSSCFCLSVCAFAGSLSLYRDIANVINIFWVRWRIPAVCVSIRCLEKASSLHLSNTLGKTLTMSVCFDNSSLSSFDLFYHILCLFFCLVVIHRAKDWNTGHWVWTNNNGKIEETMEPNWSQKQKYPVGDNGKSGS